MVKSWRISGKGVGDMWNILGRKKVHMGGVSVGMLLVLYRILNKQDPSLWTGLNWLLTGFSDEVL